MSQMVTRQGPVGEDIDKRQTASPVKEMKKKMAANAEKEKIAAEKHVDKPKDKHDDKIDKSIRKDKKETEKHADKAEKKEKSHDKKDKSLDKSVDNKDKKADKSIEKKDKSEKKEKTAEKKDKSVDTQVENSTEKKETAVVISVEQTEESTSAEKTVKQPPKDEDKKSDTVKQNGEASRQNGKASNGTASESDGEEELVIVEPDNDEMFPELAYDDTSDTEPTDTDVRSATRRSQVKVTRTPETPRPASVKQADKETDDSKEIKLLRIRDDILIPERRLRSSNSPKPPEKRILDKDSPKETKKIELETKTEQVGAEDIQENAQRTEGTVIEMVIEVENIEGGGGGAGETRRDTRYSRSRVKVSPYRRSARLADNTATSILANYTGNNTTMEMDITESFAEAESGAEAGAEPVAGAESGAGACDTSALEDSYLAALRTVRARRSYRELKPLSLTHSFNSSQHSVNSLNARESNVRPTGTVVGRKRRPEVGVGEGTAEGVSVGVGEGAKRPRLLERLARPFRTTSTPLPARRAAEIVGINTDLPQSAPVAAENAFDPETIKPTPTPSIAHVATNVTPTPTPTPAFPERDSKRCIVM